jgi:hypothetical protein
MGGMGRSRRRTILRVGVTAGCAAWLILTSPRAVVSVSPAAARLPPWIAPGGGGVSGTF